MNASVVSLSIATNGLARVDPPSAPRYPGARQGLTGPRRGLSPEKARPAAAENKGRYSSPYGRLACSPSTGAPCVNVRKLQLHRHVDWRVRCIHSHPLDDTVEFHEGFFLFYVVSTDDMGHLGSRQFVLLMQVNNSQRVHFESPFKRSLVARFEQLSFTARSLPCTICANSPLRRNVLFNIEISNLSLLYRRFGVCDMLAIFQHATIFCWLFRNSAYRPDTVRSIADSLPHVPRKSPKSQKDCRGTRRGS